MQKKFGDAWHSFLLPTLPGSYVIDGFVIVKELIAFIETFMFL